jgi:hypothetical protein
MTVFIDAYSLGYHQPNIKQPHVSPAFRAIVARAKAGEIGGLERAYAKGVDAAERHSAEHLARAAVVDLESRLEVAGWRPVSTPPPDREFVLVLCPSGYTGIDNVVTTARQDREYRGVAWINHANDRLSDGGLDPTHWRPMSDLS